MSGWRGLPRERRQGEGRQGADLGQRAEHVGGHVALEHGLMVGPETHGGDAVSA